MSWRDYIKPAPGVLRVKRVLSPTGESLVFEEKKAEKIPDRLAWIENGDLHLLASVEDLAQVIIDQTRDNLVEQKKLLRLHCQKYDPFTHFEALALKWEVQVGLLESQGVPVQLAEIQVAQKMQLLAFMDELLPLG